MAFDFLGYISQQLEQQHFNLFADETKSLKQRYITHLIAFQLNQLIELGQQDRQALHQKIQNLDANWLVNTTSQQIAQDTSASNFFEPIQPKLHDSQYKIANLILNELLQLDLTSQLGASGLKELLDGQYPWLQDEAEPWFWDSIGHPELKTTESTQPTDTDFNQVMKEFSQMIQQQAQNHPEHDDYALAEHSQTEQKIVSCGYRIANPIIAFFIIVFLFKIII